MFDGGSGSEQSQRGGPILIQVNVWEETSRNVIWLVPKKYLKSNYCIKESYY